MKRVLLAAYLAAAASYLQAEEPASIKLIPIADCKLTTVIMHRDYESVQRNAAVAKNAISILNKMQAISAKVADGKRSLKDQLSADQLSEFNVLRSRFIALQTRQIVESRYQKHLELLGQLARAADDWYRWGTAPDRDSPLAVAYGLITVLADGDPVTEAAPPTSESCSLDMALLIQETDAITASKDARFDDALSRLVTIQRKYGFRGPIDRARLSDTDKNEFDRLQPLVDKGRGIVTNINAIEQLRLLAKAMDLVHETNLTDLDQSGGAPEAVGNTLVEMRKSPGWEERLTTRVGAWAVLDKKYPSAMETDIQPLQKLFQ